MEGNVQNHMTALDNLLHSYCSNTCAHPPNHPWGNAIDAPQRVPYASGAQVLRLVEAFQTNGAFAWATGHHVATVYHYYNNEQHFTGSISTKLLR
jgi:hypothetical protein